MNDLSRIDIDRVLAAPKVIRNPLKYNLKSGSLMQAEAYVECDSLSELNLRFRATYNIFRDPRKFSLMLFVNGVRFYALDVNPGGTHRNKVTRECVRGTHWQVFPDMEATSDTRNLMHAAWMQEFSKKACIDFVGGYTKPKFEEEDKQQDLLGGL